MMRSQMRYPNMTVLASYERRVRKFDVCPVLGILEAIMIVFRNTSTGVL